jgi:hypothetical protein
MMGEMDMVIANWEKPNLRLLPPNSDLYNERSGNGCVAAGGSWYLGAGRWPYFKKLQRPLLPKEHENAKAAPKLAAACPNCQIRRLAHLLFKPTTPQHR